MSRFIILFFFSSLLNLYAQNTENLVLNAKIEIDFENYDNALIYLDSIANKDFYTYYLTGESFFQLKDYSNAITNFKSCNQLLAKYADFDLAKAFALSEDYKSAQSSLKSYLDQAQKKVMAEIIDEPSFSTFKTTEFWSALKIEEAYSKEEKAIARAAFYKSKGEIGLALDMLDELIDENKAFAEAYFYRAEFILDLNNDYKYAIDDLKKAIKINPTQYKYHNRLANYYSHELKYSKAIKHYELALQIFPYQLSDYLKLSQAYYRTGDHENAKKNIDLFLEIDFGNIDAFKLAGQLYYDIEDYKTSIFYFTEGIYINSRRIDLLVLRGNAYMESEDFQRAEMDYNIAANIDPRNGEYWFLKALALLQLERRDEACKYFKKARYLNYYQADVYLLEECK